MSNKQPLRILLATGAPTLPQMIGGSQRSGDTLLKGLRDRGHIVAITAGLDGGDLLGFRGRVLMKFSGRLAIEDNLLGYTAYRSWFPHLSAQEVNNRFRPDVVVVLAHDTGRVAKAFHETGAPILFNFQDVEFDQHGLDLAELGSVRGVGNSVFTASAYRDRFGADCTVIYPMVNPENYRTETTGEYVTFINPAPVKGLEIALKVASLLPQINFWFQETWPMSDLARAELSNSLSSLPNVHLGRRANDMRKIYAKTRILLCPSQWNEGYGRIATEAQISGIPVLGSDRGGLPEAIGNGGLVVPADAYADEWARHLQIMWQDQRFWSALSDSARSHANRSSMRMDVQLEQWENAIRAAKFGAAF